MALDAPEAQAAANASHAGEDMAGVGKKRLSGEPQRRSRSLSSGVQPEVGIPEAVRATSAAVIALADTLNALALRVALARNLRGPSDETYPAYYHRLALLAESASGQVRAIQKLLRMIELATLHNGSNQPGRPNGLRRGVGARKFSE